MQACLERIERLNGGLRAFISVYPEQALAEARAAEAAVMTGDDLGPLHGVPLAIKDLFAVRGMVRTCGSRLIDEGPGGADAESVAALRAAGGIVVGLANLHEFAFGPTGINPQFRHGAEPVGPRQGMRRIEQRIGLRRGGRPCPRRHGDRHRRFGAHSSGAVRHRWA